MKVLTRKISEKESKINRYIIDKKRCRLHENIYHMSEDLPLHCNYKFRTTEFGNGEFITTKFLNTEFLNTKFGPIKFESVKITKYLSYFCKSKFGEISKKRISHSFI